MNTKNMFEYKSTNYKEFLKKFRTFDSSEHSLVVLAGPFTSNREACLDELKREVLGDAVEIDLIDVITPYEEESYRNLDDCIQNIDENVPLVVFRNGEQLNGVYTAFSSSVVRYGSPQEKYFLRKVKEINAPVVVELKDVDQLDRMLIRKADAVVLFKAPSSLFEKLAWKMQHVHVHGSRFLSPRPH